MSALYKMTYAGASDVGAGVLYIGNGKIVGIDVGDMRYSGTYTDLNGSIDATVKLSAPTGGTLVTGQQLPAGTILELKAKWPSNFANGQPQPITVAGRPVQVVLEKIDNI